jgi:hypothetical protein
MAVTQPDEREQIWDFVHEVLMTRGNNSSMTEDRARTGARPHTSRPRQCSAGSQGQRLAEEVQG